MRLSTFRARRFRSLVDVELRLDPPERAGLAPDPADWVAVLRGQNGVGKSNVLRAVRIWFGLFDLRPSTKVAFTLPAGGLVGPDDVARHATGSIELEGILIGVRQHAVRIGLPNPLNVDRLDVHAELTVVDEGVRVAFPRVELDGREINELDRADPTTQARLFWSALCSHIARNGMQHVPAFRGIRREVLNLPNEPGESVDPREAYSWENPVDRLQELLFNAAHSSDAAHRRGYRAFEAAIQKPPLSRGRLSIIRGKNDDLTLLEERHLGGMMIDVPVRSLGSGEQEELSVLALTMVSGAPIVAIEEPEAHLYWETQQRLRKALEDLVLDDNNDPRQVLIETHSHEFTFGTRYFDVSMTDGVTRVGARDNPQAYPHFHEPGPVRDALRDLLKLHLRPDDPLYVPMGGKQAVTAGEMLERLDRNDPSANEFLRLSARAVLTLMAAEARGPRKS